MGMLIARRRKDKVEMVTTTESLLPKEKKKVESVQPKAKSVPIEPKKQEVVVEKKVEEPQVITTQPKFKV